MRQTQAELRLVFGVVRLVTVFSTVWAHNSSKRHGCGQSQTAGGDIPGQADVITIASGLYFTAREWGAAVVGFKKSLTVRLCVRASCPQMQSRTGVQVRYQVSVRNSIRQG